MNSIQSTDITAIRQEGIFWIVNFGDKEIKFPVARAVTEIEARRHALSLYQLDMDSKE